MNTEQVLIIIRVCVVLMTMIKRLFWQLYGVQSCQRSVPCCCRPTVAALSL